MYKEHAPGNLYITTDHHCQSVSNSMQAQTYVDQHALLLIMERGCGNSEPPWRARRWSREADSGDDHKGWEVYRCVQLEQ